MLEAACNASNIRVRGVPTAFLSKKLNEAKQKYCTYDKEFFAAALSKLAYTLSSIDVQVVGFDLFKRPYPSSKDFSIICVALVPGNSGKYGDFLHD